VDEDVPRPNDLDPGDIRREGAHVFR
jgi:hypothetical protein